MKKLKFINLMIVALFIGFGFTSCEKDSILTEDEDETPSEWELTVDEGGIGSTTVFVEDLEPGATSVDVSVKFTSNDGKMRRLYMTQNIAGAGDEKFELNIPGLSKKGDGSLDLSKNEKTEFKFKIPFPVLPDMEVGTVVYQLWATSGIGDYRNMDKRLVVGPGTITIDYGGVNPATAKVKEYTAKLLAAPTADSNSKTFISLIDGNVYPIKDGEEYVAYWDFGYYWLKKDGASLASPNDYRKDIVDIPTLAKTDEQLNKTYFKKTDLSAADFDNIITSSQLDYIEQSSDETINTLVEGNIIEFVDNYGNKGLIKVLEIKPGYGSNDYIKLDIKVQP